MVRSVAIGIAVAALAALAPAVAEAKDGQIEVVAPGNDPRKVSVSLSELGQADINNQVYRLASGPTTISNGYSMGKVLREAEARAGGWLDLETLPSVEVGLPSGGVVELSRAQALDPNFFDDGPPVFYESNGNTVFVMPGSPGRAYTFRFAPVDIKAGDGKVWDVSLSHSPDRPRRGQAVTITARVTGAPAGAQLSYAWSFSDGDERTTTLPRVVHRFRGSGRRSVSVNVTGADGSGYGFQTIDESPGGGGGGGDGQRDPDRDSGGTGGTGSGTSSGGGSGAGYGFGSGGGGSPGSPGAGSPVTALPESTPPDRPTPSDEGLEEVSGLLIDPSVEAGAGSTDEPVEPDQAGGGFGLSGEAATLFGVGLLIALGGLIEARLLFRRP